MADLSDWLILLSCEKHLIDKDPLSFRKKTLAPKISKILERNVKDKKLQKQ